MTTRKLHLILIALVIFGLALKYYDSHRFMGESNWAGHGDRIVGYAFDRSEVHLRDFRGQNLLVEYGSKWCPPCHAQTLETLNAFKTPIPGARLLFVLMAGNDMTAPATSSDAQSWATHYGIDNGQFAYGIIMEKRIPEIEIFDVDGKTIYRKTGSLSAQKIRELLEDIPAK